MSDGIKCQQVTLVYQCPGDRTPTLLRKVVRMDSTAQALSAMISALDQATRGTARLLRSSSKPIKL